MPGWRTPISAPRRSRLIAAAMAIAAAAVALVVIGATVGSGAPARTDFGQAKNFTLAELGHPARQLSLRSMAGRPLIVNFFASWCAPCQKETPLLARFYHARQGHLAIIGVDVNDSSSAAMAFVRKSGVSYPVAVDPAPMKAALAYNLPGLPATFFLNARHRIVQRIFGPVTKAELASGVSLITADTP
jgi:thiol-disulfide isomerase/thioredoxin